MAPIAPALAVLLALASGPQRGTSPGRPLPPYDAEPEEIRNLLHRFDHPADEFPWTYEVRNELPTAIIARITFPSPVTTDLEANNTVAGSYMRPPGPGPHPALVLLHWLEGDFSALGLLGAALARRGVATLAIAMPYYPPRRGESERRMVSADVPATVEAFRQAVADTRRAAHWLRHRPEIDADRVGVLGISLGAIVAATACGVDPDLSPAIPVLGGGDLPAILTRASTAEFEPLRRTLEEGAWTPQRLAEALRPIEPLTYAHRIRPDGVLMISARQDEIIPPDCARRLAEAIGGPRHHWIDGGHFGILGHAAEIVELAARHAQGADPRGDAADPR